MLKKRISFLLSLVMLFSILCLPAYAQSDQGKILQIANQTYDNNMKQLNANQQQEMKNVFSNIQNKYLADPVGYISGSYMAMVTGGADTRVQAIMAAWGVQKHPDSLCLVNNLGYALFLLKDYENAIEIDKQALEIDDKSLETIVNLGNVYLDMDQDDQAKATYESALKIDQNYAGAWNGLFTYYMKKKDLKSAMDIAAKHKSGGFIQQGTEKMQADADAESQAAKLDDINDSDSLDQMDQKLEKITETKPLTVAPIVAEIDPAVAKQINDQMENLDVKVQIPDAPWPIDYSSAEQYTITYSAFGDSSILSNAATTPIAPTIDPEALKKGQQIAAMSKEQIDSMVKSYTQSIGDVVNQIKGTDLNNYSQMMQAMKDIQGIPTDPFASLSTSTTNSTTTPSTSTSTSTTPSLAQQMGVTDNPGTVTTSNFNNYARHKINIQKYFTKMENDFAHESDKMTKNFQADMTQLKQEQAASPPQNEGQRQAYTRARNGLRDKYVQEFGDFMSSFYRSHVGPALQKVEDTQALYIKNMGNPKLRSSEADQMKVEINGFLKGFSTAQAPIDAYEPETDAAAQQLQEKIAEAKKNAPKPGETLPKLKNFEDQQKSLLEKIVEGAKFECKLGLAAVKVEDAELTIKMNDPISNQYMDLGMSIKGGDLAASLTEGKGFDVGFKVSEGEGPLKGVEAEAGYNGREPGQKTVLNFNEDGQVKDASVTPTEGSSGFSAGVDYKGTGIEGEAGFESNAEGESSFASSIKVTQNKFTVFEQQYKDKAEK